MAIQTVLYQTRPDGVRLYRTYSDAGKALIQDQTGTVYDEAIDIEGAGFTYTETDRPDVDLDAVEALRIISEGVES